MSVKFGKVRSYDCRRNAAGSDTYVSICHDDHEFSMRTFSPPAPHAHDGPFDAFHHSLLRLSPPPPSSTTSHSAASQAIPIESHRQPASTPPPPVTQFSCCTCGPWLRSRTASEVRNPATAAPILSQTRCFELFNGRFRLCGLAGRCHGPSPLYSEWPRLVHVPLRRYVPYLSFRTVTFCDIPSGTTAISRTASCTARCDSLCSYYNHISVRLQCIQVTNIALHRAGWCGPMASFTKAC